MQRAAAPVPAPASTDRRWRTALQQVADDPSRLVLHAQPIVDLTSGRVAGFELLSRFTGPWTASPDQWFAAAEQWGFNAHLQRRVLCDAIAARDRLPADTFLSVNVEPHLLSVPEVAAALIDVSDLSRLVLEITEHTELHPEPPETAVLSHVRAAGGLIAMDDAGTGYAALSQLLSLRPDIVKLDREFVAGIDRDPVKRALVEVLGELAGRMDAWMVTEGIETVAELDTLIGLDVPLAQGFLLARPAPVMLSEIDGGMVAHIRRTAARTALHTEVASLIRVESGSAGAISDDVSLTPDGRPDRVRLHNARTGAEEWAPAMVVAPGAAPAEVARRAMARQASDRFVPLVCTDGHGEVLGLITIDDLLISLSRTFPNVIS